MPQSARLVSHQFVLRTFKRTTSPQLVLLDFPAPKRFVCNGITRTFCACGKHRSQGHVTKKVCVCVCVCVRVHYIPLFMTKTCVSRNMK